MTDADHHPSPPAPSGTAPAGERTGPTLYYATGACSLAAHVVLAWIGAPYRALHVDQHAPAFRRINPSAAVPALKLNNGRVLTQSEAILRHLARSHPAADLLGGTAPAALAEFDQWSSFLTGDLHPAFFPVFAPARYTAAGDDAARDAVVAAALALVAAKLALLNDHLAGREWMTAAKRTVLDAYALPMLNWADDKLPDGLARYPAAAALRRRLLADPTVQRVIAEERQAPVTAP